MLTLEHSLFQFSNAHFYDYESELPSAIIELPWNGDSSSSPQSETRSKDVNCKFSE